MTEQLAEKIDMSIFSRNRENDSELPLAEKMALWNIHNYCMLYGQILRFEIKTEKYAFTFNIDIPQ
jgi:hypothetical protein